MLTERASGVLLHPTSIPTRFGIGDLGPRAYEFIDWLAGAQQKYWQGLPLCPADGGGSPYQSASSFAGNPLLIHTGDTATSFPAHAVDFGRVIPAKQAALREHTRAMPDDAAYQAFREAEQAFQKAQARFKAALDAHMRELA